MKEITMVVLAFLKGKYGLAGTFWGFIVVALVIYNLLSILIFNHLFQFSDYANFKLGYTLFFILPFMYLPVVMIAVWNSATCYQGPQIWVISSKAMMGLLMLALVYHAGSYLVSQYSEKLTKADLIALSSTLNKSLPQVIEPNIFFNKTSFENNRFLFHF